MNHKQYGWVVGQHANGITLNPLRYLMDDNNNFIHFSKKQEAVNFLKENGFTDEDIQDSIVFKIYTICEQCGEEIFIAEHEYNKDDLGYCYYHNDCKMSFDLEVWFD